MKATVMVAVGMMLGLMGPAWGQSDQQDTVRGKYRWQKPRPDSTRHMEPGRMQQRDSTGVDTLRRQPALPDTTGREMPPRRRIHPPVRPDTTIVPADTVPPPGGKV